MSKNSPGDKWAFDLAAMLQVGLLAFVVAGAATTSSYFDLSFQLIAMCALLKHILEAKDSVSGMPKAAVAASSRLEGSVRPATGHAAR